MFTGIIEEIGEVKSYNRGTNGARLCVLAQKVIHDLKIGDSICINGVCETVTSFDKSCFYVDISDETLRMTTFKNLSAGDKLNLERALMPASRLGGHIVSGHVDGTATIIKTEKLSQYYNLTFIIPEQLCKYVVYKGSVTLNGISLTIARIDGNKAEAAIIPHTYMNTNLQYLSIGDSVNIETDMLGRYVEKLLNENKNDSDITMSLLEENGFV